MADTPVLVLPGVVGTVNAGGGGGKKFLSGTFSTAARTDQNYFTVSGLDFEPRVICIWRTSYANTGTSAVPTSIARIAWFDVETGSGDLGQGNNGGDGGFGSCAISISKNGAITTITTPSCYYSESSNYTGNAYGSFMYNIYG